MNNYPRRNGSLFASATLVLGISAAGCAHLPDATLNYHLVTSKVGFKVVRTVACDASKNLVVANAVTPLVVHSADRSVAGTKNLELKKLKGALSDSDVKFDFYDDGRLKGFNGSSTGQGEAILKTAITIAAALGFDATGTRYASECAFITNAGGGKPLTLTYEGAVDLGKGPADEQPIDPDVGSQHYSDRLKVVIGTVCAYVEGKGATPIRAEYTEQAGDVLLDAREPGFASIRIKAGGQSICRDRSIWYGNVPVAQFGSPYKLPIPPPTAFGKRLLAAAFAESGALTSIQFASNTGAGQGLNVIAAGLDSTAGATAEEKVAAVKTQADLIAQQQRLVQCLTDPPNCK